MNKILCPNCKSKNVINRTNKNTNARQPIWQCQNDNTICKHKMYYGRWMTWASWDENPSELNIPSEKNAVDIENLSNLLDTKIDNSLKNYIQELNSKIDNLEKKIEKSIFQKFINYQETELFESNEERYNRELVESEDKEKQENFNKTGVYETNLDKNRRLYEANFNVCPTCSVEGGRHAPSCGS